jgi:hypothetical protein
MSRLFIHFLKSDTFFHETKKKKNNRINQSEAFIVKYNMALNQKSLTFWQG